MSNGVSDELLSELSRTYKDHCIELVDSKYICTQCKMSAWDESFPEYCVGKVKINAPFKLMCNNGQLNIHSTIYEEHDRLVISFKESNPLSDGFELDLQRDGLQEFINKLKDIASTFETQ